MPFSRRLVAFLALLTPGLPAQQSADVPRGSQSAPIWYGTVVDTSGAAVVGARLTVRTSSGSSVTLTSDSGGSVHLALPSGAPFVLTVAAPGFASLTQTMTPGGTSGSEPFLLVLNVGTSSVSIEVEGDTNVAPEPGETQLGTVVARAQLEALPSNGRSFTDRLALTPGVVPVSAAQPNAVVMSGVASTPPSGDLDPGALSVSGQRETANSFRVNNSDVQEDVNMGVAVVPSLDSIASIEVLTGSFDAKLGNQSGGQILVRTRSGGSKVHGSLYNYLRNTRLDARNFFSLTRAPFHRNQFGGTLGGPVPGSDKLFFFADYQGTRETQGVETGLIAVPSPSERTGNFAQAAPFSGTVSGSYLAQLLSTRLGRPVASGEAYTKVFPGGIIPASAFSAPARALLRYIPEANQPNDRFSSSSYAQRLADDKGSLRLDRATRLGELTGYYFVDNYTLLTPYPTGQGGATVPGFNAFTAGRAQLFTANLVTTVASNTVNQLHGSYLRNAASVGQPRGGVGTTLASQGFLTGAGTNGIDPLLPASEGVENIVLNSFTFGTDVTSLFQAENLFEVTDDLSRVVRYHLLSFGIAIHADQINTHPTVYDNGSFSFTGSETGSDFADFLLGVDTSYTQGQGRNFYNRNHYLALYGQDRWSVRPGLTLNLGLRWDVLPPWSEKFNQLLTLNPAEQSVVFPNAPKGILFPGDPAVPRTLAPTRYGNVAPRVALSWEPWQGASPWAHRLLGPAGSTSLRAGFGLYYTSFEGLSAGIMSGNPPYGFTDTVAVPTLFDQPFVAAATGVSVGQRFPLQAVPFGASTQHPVGSVDWTNFEPLTGIPAFAQNNVTPYAENYSLSLERQLTSRTVATASFVGTQAHHLLVIQEVNPGDPATCLALSTPGSVAANSAQCGPFGESGTYTTASGVVVQGTRRAFSPAFGSVNLQRTIANSHDNALELSLRHTARALAVQLSYTFSKSIDQSSGLAEAVYPTDAGRSRALSAFDLTQNFVASYRYLLPLGLLAHRSGQLADGWQVSGVTRLNTGFPVTLLNNNDTSLLGTEPNGINNNGIDEPAFRRGPLRLLRRPSGNAPAFNTSLFSLPDLGTLGNARRRFFYGPGAENTDLSLSKTTRVDTRSIELRMDAFNVFNHGQFFGPAAVNGNLSSSNFGSIQSSSAPRLLQVAARLQF